MAISSFALCSNELERLYEGLVEDILLRADKEALLSFRCIVPSASLKAWLTVALGESGVSLLAGEILLLEEALFWKKTSKRALLPLLISFLENIQHESWGHSFFKAHCEELPLTQERIFRFAKRYLVQFAQKALFDDDVWFKGCEQVGEAFSQVVKRPEQSFTSTPTFLFGFSSLHDNALKTLLRTFTVQRLYFLSPSMLFWGDHCSDNEIRALLKKGGSEKFEEAFMPYLLDRQKFLANSGLIGREFLNLLEDLDLPIESTYKIPEPFFLQSPYQEFLPMDGVEKALKKPTLLDHVKADLLLLIDKRETLQEVALDNSIGIHAAYTPLREVEALKEALHCFFEKTPLKSGSVIVLATNLKKYLAPFEEVFGGKKALFRVWNEGLGREQLALLTLIKGFCFTQGGKKDFLSLIRHPLFLKSFGIPKEEKEELFAFFEKTDFISWSETSRKRYLEQRGIFSSQQAKTFEQVYRNEIENFFLEGSLTKHTLLSFLAKVRAWIESVSGVIALPLNPQELQTVGTWVAFLKKLFDPLLQEDGSLYAVEKALLALGQYTEKSFLPFSEVFSFFLSEAEELTMSMRGLNAPIILAEFGTFQPFLAEVIAILGAEEGSLPKEEENALDYLEKLPPRIYPSSKLYERYAFIESILSAKKLFIGYQSYAFELREKVAFSKVVADLLAHIDSNFLISGQAPSKAICLQHSLHRKKRKVSLQPFQETLSIEKKRSSVIDFSEIQKTGKNPIVRYVQAKFGAFDEWEENASIFIKNFELKMHLEEKILGKKSFSKRGHALALQAYNEAEKEANKVLQELGEGSFSSINVEFVPTIKDIVQSENTLFIPAFEHKGKKVQGAWKGLLEQALLIFSESWNLELFQKWPEYVFRSFLLKEYSLPFEEKIILIKEKKKIDLPIKDPKALFASWIEFSQLATLFPFPFSRDIVSMLLKKPSVEDVFIKLEADKSLPFTIPSEKVEVYKEMWEEWANLLFSDLLRQEDA